MKLTEYQDLNYISYERLPMRTGVVPYENRALALRDCRRALLADFPDAEILQEQRTVTVQNGTAHAEVRYLFTADIAQAAQD